jgi:hypothetical protein
MSWSARSSASPEAVPEPQLLDSTNSFEWPKLPQWPVTTLVIVISLLLYEQYVWRSKKKHLPGVKWSIPLIGAFADSLNPTMEAYKRTWATPLSAASVFNMSVAACVVGRSLGSHSAASLSWSRTTPSRARS